MNRLLSRILRTPSAAGQDMAEEILSSHYPTVRRNTLYCYAAGTIPVLLVAHTDTVHDDPPQLHYDARKRVAWSPTGLGADDRAGVYAIARLLADGLRPHVLLTDEEETGGHGAKQAARDLFPDVHCLIQLDRAGANDAVYYSCASDPLEDWITGHGFKTARGTYSDIADLMPAWEIAGVNLSVGYYAQHTHGEYLRVKQLERTIARVRTMLQNPPDKPFPYVPAYTPARSLLSHSLSLDLDYERWPCSECCEVYDIEELDDMGLCPECLEYLTSPGREDTMPRF